MSKEDAVVSEIDIAASPEEVYRALTDQKELFVWWGAEPAVELKRFEMDARVGGRWGFECVDRAGRPINGVKDFKAHGEIVEMDPPRLLVYTWIANWHNDPKRPTLVRWELQKTKSGTRVRVTHSGLAADSVARKDYTEGWPGVLELLEKFFKSRKQAVSR